MKENMIGKLGVPYDWRKPLVVTLITFSIYIVVYFNTFASMVSIWERSETFAHGFLIVPISLWLIWRNRTAVLAEIPHTNYWGLIPLFLLGLAWLIAVYIDVLVIQQLSVVLMVPVLVLTLLGWHVVKILAFPLLYLLFAVPMGEELVPYLINFTADFTVAMVQLVGIPVYREGTFFELPTGNWSVVTACSGVRYLIASAALGFLYAHLTYKSLTRKILFVVISFIVPIIANGLRAFMIVMIGHFSDMKLATGVDHLIYGWLFFGIVIALMFFVGSFWREDDIADSNNKITLDDAISQKSKIDSRKLVIAAISSIVIILIWPLKTSPEHSAHKLSPTTQIEAPLVNGWNLVTEPLTSWRPQYDTVDQNVVATYEQKGQKVFLYLGRYVEQRQDAELINFNNVLVHENDKVWRSMETRNVKVSLDGQNIDIPMSWIESPAQKLKVLYFYHLDGTFSSGQIQTKLLEARARLLGRSSAGSVVIVASEFDGTTENAQKVINEFLEEAYSSIKATLETLN